MRRLAIIVAVSLSCAVPVYAQSPRVTGNAGDWVKVEAGGLVVIYRTSDASTGSSVEIACDEAMTLDHSMTGIAVEIDSKMLPADSRLSFTVNGRSIVIPTGPSGGMRTRGCPECAEAFMQLRPLLREGTRLHVTASDGSRASFGLRGTAQLMPTEPCRTGS